MTLQDTPKTTTLHRPGTGLWVSEQVGFGRTPTMLGRIYTYDPDDVGSHPRPDIGPPSYQLVLIYNPLGGPDYYAVLHGSTSEKFIVKPLSAGTDPHSSPDAFTLVDQGTVLSFGTAAAGLWRAGASTPFLVWSEPLAADGLGVQFHSGLSLFTSGAAPIVSGAHLGFSSADILAKTWTGFVCLEDDGNVVVIGHAIDTTALAAGSRERFGGQYLYRFVLDPTVTGGGAASVVEEATLLSSDAPFLPHQLARGRNVPLDGTTPKELLFCVGYSSPSRWYQEVVNAANFHNVNAHGVWVTDDLTTYSGWRRVWSSAAGLTTNPVHVPVPEVSTPQTVQTVDMGLVFDEAWQRLTVLGIDTDAQQDPVSAYYDEDDAP